MGCPAEVEIGDNLVFSIMTHDPDTGVLTDADSAPAYRIYEAEASATVFTGTMTKLDDGNTTGFYTELIACTAGVCNNGKTYTIYIVATVDSDQGGISFAFKAYDDRKANVIKISDDAAAASNLELDYDGTGYTKANSTIGSASSIGDKTGYSISGTKTTLDALTDGSGVTVTTNNDKTGYSISGTKQTLDALTDGSGVTITTNNDKTGYSISGSLTTLDALENLSAGTIMAVSAGTLVIVANMNAGVMSAGAFAGSAITASALAANIITNSTLAAGAIDNTTFAGSALTASAIAAGTIDLFWDEVVDGTTTARESFVISNTILAGKVSGGSSTTATFRDLADGKDRIVIVFTVDGDKTSVTFSDIAA